MLPKPDLNSAVASLSGCAQAAAELKTNGTQKIYSQKTNIV
jgi:hypothetical protein